MKKVLQNGVFIFLFLMGIQSFFIKGRYMVVLGSMLILTSILFFSYLDKVMNLIKVIKSKFILKEIIKISLGFNVLLIKVI